MIKRRKSRLPNHIIVPENTPYPNFQQNVHESCCSNCGRHITLYDRHHDENFCLTCGAVTPANTVTPNNVVYGSHSYGKVYSGTGYTSTEKMYFKSKHRKVPSTYTSDRERANIEYKNIIYGFKNDLCLDKIDIEDIFIIMRKCGGLTKILAGTPAKTVLLGIARYLLIHKKIRGNLVNFTNRIYRRNGLTRKLYDKLVRNIEKHTRIYT